MEQNEIKRLREMLAISISGGMAFTCADLLYYPIETIKVRIQASSIHVNYVE